VKEYWVRDEGEEYNDWIWTGWGQSLLLGCIIELFQGDIGGSGGRGTSLAPGRGASNTCSSLNGRAEGNLTYTIDETDFGQVTLSDR
jgi:hypothetical protein